jgi:hypothetical protein
MGQEWPGITLGIRDRIKWQGDFSSGIARGIRPGIWRHAARRSVSAAQNRFPTEASIRIRDARTWSAACTCGGARPCTLGVASTHADDAHARTLREPHIGVAQQERSYAGGRRLSQSNRAELRAHCSASGAAGCSGRGTGYAILGARRRSPDIRSTQSAKRRELMPHMGGPVAGKIRCGSDGLRLARRGGPARR